MGDAAKHDYSFKLGQCRQAGFQEVLALVDFCANRLVLWRNTAHGIGDHSVMEADFVRCAFFVWRF